MRIEDEAMMKKIKFHQNNGESQQYCPTENQE